MNKIVEIKYEIKINNENINGYYEIFNNEKRSKIIIEDKKGIRIITEDKIIFDKNLISDKQ